MANELSWRPERSAMEMKETRGNIGIFLNTPSRSKNQSQKIGALNM